MTVELNDNVSNNALDSEAKIASPITSPIKPRKAMTPFIASDEIPMNDDNFLPKGTRLTDFKILGVIGEGGFGIVYFAFDKSLRRMVAIKEYMPGALAGRGANQKVMVRSGQHQETFAIGLKSFINEARLLAQFDHPALIKVYRFWEQNNTGYMAMRYYEGRTLRSVVKNAPESVTEEWLKSILKPMLEALDAMYRLNILHRDISPDNIMIQKTGEAVLLDFGAARQVIGDMTHSLTVILKPGYAPIEQYADDTTMKQGAWTDIYSLCAVMYFTITGKAPATSMARMIKDPMMPLAGVAEYQACGFSCHFLAAIDAGLAVNPEERPQSIEAFRQFLDLELSVPMPTQQARVSMMSKGSSNLGNKRIVDLQKIQKNAKKWWRATMLQVMPLLKIKPAEAALITLGFCVIGMAGYFFLRSATTMMTAPAPAPAPAQIVATSSAVVDEVIASPMIAIPKKISELKMAQAVIDSEIIQKSAMADTSTTISTPVVITPTV
ncbi:MAG: serine/threonine protein kinase, partial [Glaciimonas sp.]|nr:serine/threonine protein kinase [Glaciimonas sp.]